MPIICLQIICFFRTFCKPCIYASIIEMCPIYYGRGILWCKNDHAVTKEYPRCGLDNFLLTLPISDSY